MSNDLTIPGMREVLGDNPMGFYILAEDCRTPIPCPDVLTWGRWMETGNRTVGKTIIGPVEVSTVFLGINHNHFGQGPPILFETMYFLAEESSGWCRYCTWDDAVAGHEAACIAARKEQNLLS